VDGFEDGDGCPEPDNDKDGVSEMADACPLDRGSTENKGCPDTDRDGDTVGDRLDNCPPRSARRSTRGAPGSSSSRSPRTRAHRGDDGVERLQACKSGSRRRRHRLP
jgi:hypothetical protein